MMRRAEDRQVWLLIAGTSALFVVMLLGSWALGVQYDYTLRIVALGGAILGLVSGVLGSFAVLRQQSLMGDALSHAALPGVAIAFLIAGRDLGVLLIGAGIAGWLGVQFINAVTSTTRIKQDTAMAMALASFFAIGIALLSYIQGRGDAGQAGLDSFIFGQAASIQRNDVVLISVVGSIAFAVLFAFWKEFKLITFNREFAEANGFNVRFLDSLLSLLIVVAIVLGLQLAGVILMVGMLIAPAVAARQWTHKLGQMVALSGLFGAFSGASGAIISGIDVGLPTGPLIIVVASLIVTVSLMFAPERGLVATMQRQRRDRRQFATTNVLRDLYTHGLQHNNPHEPMRVQTLINVRGTVVNEGIHELERRNHIDRQNGTIALNTSGVKAALRDARNQHLWQLYRSHNEQLNLPIVPEDRNKPIDEFLPETAIRKLEALRGEPA